MPEGFNLNRVLTDLSIDKDSSLEELFTYYYPRLYNFSKSFLKLEDGIDDILQEVFVKIWQNRKIIKSPTTFNSYIFTITRNLLLNELRSRLNKKNVDEKFRKLSISAEYSLSEEIEYQELKEKVDSIINGLPERSKEIFVLSRTEGLSHKEIADKLKISTKTVEYHITQSVRYLKTKLEVVGLASMLYFCLFF